MSLKIGILGGSFNPIHLGHLLLAESARDKLGLDKVLFIPTGSHPFKDAENDPGSEHRYEMTRLAIEDNPKFDLSDIEVHRQGYTYTIDTLRELDKTYKEDELYFITGADIVFEIDAWKSAPEVLERVTLVTTFRPGHDQDRLDARIRDLMDLYDAKIYKLHTPEMDISSSEIRSRVKHGYSFIYLVPKKVESYIKEKGLYL
ncbi:MAG TPA: nicotinic acid mononucleotide adenylyltransferase [Eubacteriaceae bacterium]|nr:nicotinic acid mononucleotide adenylyltransferase [Eubacteriaceae bacterium]